MYEEDEEALAIWRDVVGVDPSRIRKMGAADNFWASGPTGTRGGGAGVHRAQELAGSSQSQGCCHSPTYLAPAVQVTTFL